MEKQKVEIVEAATEVNLPSMSVSVGAIQTKEDQLPVITNDKMISLYSEILDYIRDDRKEASEAYDMIKNMVVNEGDATEGSKEAMVNMLKLRHETSDKMTRVMDLLMRVILKDRSTYQPFLNQENKIIINAKQQRNTRSFIEKLLEEEKK